MRNHVILAADGPAVRVEFWRDMRLVRAYVVPVLDDAVVRAINQFAGIQIRVKES